MSTTDHAGAEAGPGITLKVNQQKYLPAGSAEHEMHAVLTVTARGLRAGAAAGPEMAEVIVIDCSSSMWPMKITAAQRATAAAVEVLPDGTRFAIVEGTHEARVVYPGSGGLAVAGPDTRAEATRAAHRLVASGGTSVSAWLSLARELLDATPAPLRHVLLLTDGKNEHDAPGVLDRVLAQCVDHFTCDARGIGDEWDAKELTRITGRLHGAADAVLVEGDLAEEFRAVLRRALGRTLPDLRLRITHRAGSRIRMVKQLSPTEADLTARGREVEAHTREYPTRAWGDESRQYQVCLTAEAGRDPKGEDVQLGYVELVVDAPGVRLPEPEAILVHWTDDPALSSRVDPHLDHFARQAEMKRAVTAGCEALDDGDRAAAREELGRAVRLAHALGDDRMVRRLENLVEIEDAAAGRVRLRDVIRPLHVQSAIVSTTHSGLVGASAGARAGEPSGGAGRPHPSSPDRAGAPDVVCRVCGRRSPADAAFCTACGTELREGR
ncbi:VWA domain-containing protein [Allostreptomyces psammosilenae]|uniref:VWFA domain-containing protein n=1 Tax=Allostreptomyces psammosilenae TaxID=1892865 RepID=A0A852ZRR9_9ACTN|nr:VWA domain-containing protein [Allostreptomyces psammosilenae]NYI05083.1 hypothetical protein [Allostreptomyces psammosilenae]